jgi:hypothetical protein
VELEHLPAVILSGRAAVAAAPSDGTYWRSRSIFLPLFCWGGLLLLLHLSHVAAQ